MKLIIVESPAKAKKIQTYDGNDKLGIQTLKTNQISLHI